MNDPFLDDPDAWFYVPECSVWEDFVDAFPSDEDFDCDAAENVLDDIILIEV